ncbi:hypothetical protein RHECNPAF_1760083 [Rhizobium etli CNPAF512]|nr:hypothetical protein RHECNPAF_1760083 [Rhizobium etli CNPAF512]
MQKRLRPRRPKRTQSATAFRPSPASLSCFEGLTPDAVNASCVFDHRIRHDRAPPLEPGRSFR